MIMVSQHPTGTASRPTSDVDVDVDVEKNKNNACKNQRTNQNHANFYNNN